MRIGCANESEFIRINANFFFDFQAILQCFTHIAALRFTGNIGAKQRLIYFKASKFIVR